MSEDKDVLFEKVREFESRTGHTIDSFPDDPENTASVLKERRHLSEPLSPENAKRQMFSRSRRGFLVGGVATLAGIFGWRWMSDKTKEFLYQGAFALNEQVSQFFYRPSRLAKEFPPERITEARINGMEGLENETNEQFIFVSRPGISSAQEVSIEEIKRLPRTEMITELKCIEGWSIIVNWAGVRFSDFAAYIMPNRSMDDLPEYVSLATPDGKYFVGWDTPSIMHPQTLLAYEMNGEPLTSEHGAPLRLASPTKYGIKQIKRIGMIEFTNSRPKDFWAEYGYDWYAGL